MLLVSMAYENLTWQEFRLHKRGDYYFLTVNIFCCRPCSHPTTTTSYWAANVKTATFLWLRNTLNSILYQVRYLLRKGMHYRAVFNRRKTNTWITIMASHSKLKANAWSWCGEREKSTKASYDWFLVLLLIGLENGTTFLYQSLSVVMPADQNKRKLLSSVRWKRL